MSKSVIAKRSRAYWLLGTHVGSLQPGPIVVSDPDFAGLEPNYRLHSKDFPFRQLEDPTDRGSSIVSDTNNVASSQGVHHATFGQDGRPDPTPMAFGSGGPTFVASSRATRRR